ncbi:hypothetical protein Anapl_12481 [Anas platyrhynchos]|uniref:Uncharacterized protein n=1 Tax=Anas platyrhynchos TaxID=8839 RepID=R0KF42_ANAPL|nr:hypothetical protein Anapl_12481 [Anas platyrhynchos]
MDIAQLPSAGGLVRPDLGVALVLLEVVLSAVRVDAAMPPKRRPRFALRSAWLVVPGGALGEFLHIVAKHKLADKPHSPTGRAKTSKYHCFRLQLCPNSELMSATCSAKLVEPTYQPLVLVQQAESHAGVFLPILILGMLQPLV